MREKKFLLEINIKLKIKTNKINFKFIFIQFILFTKNFIYLLNLILD